MSLLGGFRLDSWPLGSFFVSDGFGLRVLVFARFYGRLEQEAGFFFNMKYFEEKVQAGEWEEAEKYLSGYTKVDDNRYSMKIFFEIRKQKYLEALDRFVRLWFFFPIRLLIRLFSVILCIYSIFYTYREYCFLSPSEVL